MPGPGWLVLGSTPLGYSETSPLLPSTTTGASKIFTGVDGLGSWFDPEGAPAYAFEITEGASQFLPVGMPSRSSDADQLFTIDDGINDPVVVVVGESHQFNGPVTSFEVSGIGLQGDDEQFSAFLQFDQETVDFSMTPIPEPGVSTLTLASIFAFPLRRRRDH